MKLCLLAAIACFALQAIPTLVFANLAITTDTTQDGGTLVVSPEGDLIIAGASNPTLTLTNQSTSSGVTEVTVGEISTVSGPLSGKIDIRQSSVLTTTGKVELLPRTNAEISVSGVGSLLEAGSIFFSGLGGLYEGSGALSIENGGQVSAEGFEIRSKSVVDVSGVGSALEFTASNFDHASYFSVYGDSSVSVLGGGRISAKRRLSLGAEDFSSLTGKGFLHVAGIGSRFEIKHESTNPSLQQFREINVRDGAIALEAGASLSLGGLGVFSQPDADLGESVLISGSGTIAEIEALSVSGTYDPAQGLYGSTVRVADGAKIVEGRRTLGNGSSTLGFAPRLYLGVQEDTAGSLVFSGEGSSALLRGGLPHIIGGAGRGRLTVEGGASLSPQALINVTLAEASGSHGQLNISGIGSYVETADLIIGQSGTGMLAITDGGYLKSYEVFNGEVVVGKNAESSSMVEISGAGSTWEINGQLTLASEGAGHLLVQEGGTVKVSDVLNIGSKGTISGDGGSIVGDIYNTGIIAPGNSPGTLLIDGALDNNGIIVLEIAGPDDFDQLTITGQFDAGGIVQIDFLDGYLPSLGETYDLLTFGSLIDNGLTVEALSLDTGIQIDTSDLLQGGSITVTAVPEPSTIGLVVLAAVGYCARRKRIVHRSHTSVSPHP